MEIAMPLTVSGPPAATGEAIAQQVAGLVRVRGGGGRRLAAADRSALALAVGHPVYTAGLADAESGDVGREAVQTDWRYLVQEGDETIATADATLEDAPTVTQVGEGPFGPATARAVAVAEALPQVRSRTYELRTLRVPPLKVVALWLHADDDDLYIPLEPPGAGLTPYVAYDRERFDAALAAAAQARRRLPPDAVS
jgi:hypothetical protein